MLALILLAVIVYKLSAVPAGHDGLVVPPSPGCDVGQGPCSARLPSGALLHLEISPRPVPVLIPFDVSVSLEAGMREGSGQPEVDFAGVAMDMGVNRIHLSPAGNGRFIGKATLPVCVTGRMLWRATVRVDDAGRRIAVPFDFAVGS